MRRELLTIARCCWPVPYVLSFNAVAPLLPLVANLGIGGSTGAVKDG